MTRGKQSQRPEESGQQLPVNVRYVALENYRRDPDDSTLAEITFGTAAGQCLPTAIGVNLEPLGENFVEVWHSGSSLHHDELQGVAYAANDEFLFATLNAEIPDSGDISGQSYTLYRRLHDFLQASGYPHPLRIWNYFPGINEGAGDEERYKQFCAGRAEAVVRGNLDQRHLPAASATGTREGGLQVCLVAGRQPGEQIENPRQVSAYHYPRQYGPSSPSFARATLKTCHGTQMLFISGTASIVGHETLHPGDVARQLDETIQNIEKILETADKDTTGISDLALIRVYIRHAEDYPLIRDRLETLLGPEVPVLYLQADICRSDLLLEIEGFYHS